MALGCLVQREVMYWFTDRPWGTNMSMNVSNASIWISSGPLNRTNL
jgi:hypothetical protein